MKSKIDLGKAFKFEIKLPYFSKFKKISELPTFTVEPDRLIENQETIPNLRIKILLAVFGILISILVLRTFYLQIIQGEYNFERASENRLIVRKIPAPRGIIYDRNGEVLASNKAIFKLVKNGKAQLISKEQALELEAQNLASETLEEGLLGKIEIDLVRNYTQGEAFSHLLGYTSEISDKELKDLPDYQLGDRIGKLGLEAELEDYLKGITGQQLVEVNAKGEIVTTLGTQKPELGKNVTLTIDSALQQKVFEELAAGIETAKAKSGAAVASNPQTGEILALVSYPAFDSNLLTFGITQEELNKLNSDPARPFLNRVTQGNYPPGSIFKLVSAVAGLESGAISQNTQIKDTGVIYLGDFRFPNWNFLCCGKTEGILDITRAIARSNDIFFYRVGQWVGAEKLAEWAKRLGLGKTTGIELPEAGGLIPTPEWKQKVRGKAWFPGNTLHMAIGQGDVLTTPLQLNVLTSFFANGGELLQPFAVSEITDEGKQTLLSFKKKILGKDLVSKKSLELVREGMRQTAAPGGTAWPFADFKIPCGAKTGTAESGVENPHAWFTVFCPYQNPEIALTVLIEEAGEGSSISGPVARKIMEWYFNSKQ